MNHKTLLLSSNGADRASAYHMSTKFALRGDHAFVTYLANPYHVRLARVDLRQWAVVADTPIAAGSDNHCGASLAMTASGRLHVIAGSHHDSFIHRYSDNPADEASWSLPQAVGRVATYPSTALSRDGSFLHLAYRSSSDPWTLVYQRTRADGDWPHWSGQPRKALLRAPSGGYCYWTNSLAVDTAGTLHLLAEFYKQHVDRGGYCPAVTHLYSTDEGASWQHTDGRALTFLPVGLEHVTPISFRGGGNLRVSGMVALRDGSVAFTMVDTGRQQLLMCRRPPTGEWEIVDWAPPVLRHLPAGWKVNSHAALGESPDGQLYGCLVVAPEVQFGHPQSRLVQLCCQSGQDQPSRVERLDAWREGHPDWLPAICDAAGKGLLVLHQSGNRGEGCINAETTEVVLRLLAP